MLLFSFGAMADITADDFVDTFDSFAQDAAPSVPMLADVGLRWSDSYIGGFPLFGVGVSLGFVIVPVDDIEALFTTLEMGTPPDALKEAGGIPIPATAVEARIGGFILPFDIGIKAGYIPEAAKEAMNDGVSVDYQMVGFDVRYRIVKEGLLMPEISVGGGYTRLEGMVATSVGGSTVIDDSSGYTLTIDQSDVVFGWTSNVLDAHLQVSKNILFILRPYAGLGMSYGISEAGGGFQANITENVADAFEHYEDTYGMEVDATGVEVYSEANGFAFRAYAGTSVELLFAKA